MGGLSTREWGASPVLTTILSTPPTIITTIITMSLPHIILLHITMLISPLVHLHPLVHPHTLLDHHIPNIILHIIPLLVVHLIIANIPIMPPTTDNTTQLHIATVRPIPAHTWGATVDPIVADHTVGLIVGVPTVRGIMVDKVIQVPT